ncbi:tripartite tricarboxylate transporter substrate binding protein [Paenibacillus alginolyticus]|uniref:tripartite tricarboxylate transporter substrate binding protein n=1 Tax=Paenibacillus alginolyticus TaxID=59839 RepID=UPI0004164620|nr:tripartite tricarboxylate transporter substrate binding protein [Paenibacillus alginolyticus]MCY9667822.1 tripartite tricarboxylate transporter substrate binding protein [Paenibacillus alginolyticus]
MKNETWKKMASSVALLGMLVLTACGAGSSTATSRGEKADSKKAVTAAPTTQVKSDFPKRAITLIVPYAAGGGTDATARALAKATEKQLGQSIAIVNKTGGGGAIGFTEGSIAKPDGYTVTMVTVELATLHHLGLTPITYKEFKPIAQINFDPSAITVKVDARWKTVKEFMEYAKAHPGEVKMGNSGPGSIWHLSAVSIEKSAGVTFNHVPFDGAGPAVVALMGGHIDAVPVSPAEVKTQVEGGKLRTLAIVDAKPSEAIPGVKTLEEEIGIKPNYLGPWRGLVAPKNTPDDVMKVLEDAFMKGANDPEFKDYMKKSGLGMVIKDNQGFGKLMEDSDKSFGELIPALGLAKK